MFLGITTYRENKSENLDIKAFDLFNRGQKHQSAKHIAKTIKSRLLTKFKKIKNKDLNLLQKRILKITDNKIGGYLTYDYIIKSVTILNIQEFDRVSDEQFYRLLFKIKDVVKTMKGKLTVFQVQYKII